MSIKFAPLTMTGGSSQNNSFGAFIPFQSCIFPPPSKKKKECRYCAQEEY